MKECSAERATERDELMNAFQKSGKRGSYVNETRRKVLLKDVREAETGKRSGEEKGSDFNLPEQNSLNT